MKQFLEFFTKIKSFWKFYRDYKYDGETAGRIIKTYSVILQRRTKSIKEPTYYFVEAIHEIDEWYEDKYKFTITQTDNKFANRIDFSVEYSDLISEDDIIRIIAEKIEESREIK